VVSKFTLDAAGVEPASSALFSLKVHLKRPEAHLESDDEAVACLRELGFQHVTVQQVDVKSLVIGKRETS
jgi:hypothetical protein